MLQCNSFSLKLYMKILSHATKFYVIVGQLLVFANIGTILAMGFVFLSKQGPWSKVGSIMIISP